MNKLPLAERDYDDIMAQSWLELVCFQKDEQENNEICENLEETFSDNRWPETPLPRLPMGPWRIKSRLMMETQEMRMERIQPVDG